MIKWLYGYICYGVKEADSKVVLNLMLKNDISYFDLKKQGDECSFCLLCGEYNKLLSILDKTAQKGYIVYEKGLPFLVGKHKNRIGLLIGLCLFLAIIVLSSFFVWDIRVKSETIASSNEILENLEKLGVYKGTFIPSVDFDDVCYKYVKKHKDCAWISVNVRGTVAYVEIQEKKAPKSDEEKPQNLVAMYDAQIVDCTTYSGRLMVGSGNVVKQGDVLISGVVNNADDTLRICHASGEIIGIVDRDFVIDVPYKYTEKYDGEKVEKKKLKFFNIHLPLPGGHLDKSKKYKKNTESDGVVLFEKIELPLSIEKVVYTEQKQRQKKYSKKEVQTLSYNILKEKIDAELPGATLQSIETNGEHTEKGYTLTCHVKCKMNIGIGKEIYLG